MVRKPSHKWAFKPGMRAGAFGWRGSAKAIERLKSARTEIRAVNRADPVAAAEGVVALAERIGLPSSISIRLRALSAARFTGRLRTWCRS